MKRNEILEVIKSLATSQGFYGRLYNTIMSLDIEDFELVMSELEEQNFKTSLDLVLYLEQ